MKKYIILLLAFSLFAEIDLAFSLDEKPAATLDPLAKYSVDNLSKNKLDWIANRFEIISRNINQFEVLVPQSQIKLFNQKIPTAKLLDQNIRRTLLNELKKQGGNKKFRYRRWDEVVAHLKNLAELHPDILQLSTYGKTQQGKDQYVLKISDDVSSDEDEPEIMLTSATHGDELITVEMLLGLIDKLVAGYGNNTRLTSLINDYEIFFIPVVNPDGFYSRSRYANGVDPNRNYPWPENEHVESVACIKNIRNFFSEREFVGSIDFHASGEMIMYPWAYTRSSPPQRDERTFRQVTEYMAAANDYRAGQISIIIYVAKGSSADYYYWKKDTIALGIEIARSKIPGASTIPNIIEDNSESTWRFIESF